MIARFKWSEPFMRLGTADSHRYRAAQCWTPAFPGPARTSPTTRYRSSILAFSGPARTSPTTRYRSSVEIVLDQFRNTLGRKPRFSSPASRTLIDSGILRHGQDITYHTLLIFGRTCQTLI
ncbi:hypothetical protein J6590_022558 [Homalodisca vitripennis]|nr:hypothetical protein J6590_022558 [Homalodisca vitripennis]